MDVLWAPWRMAYIGGPASRGCIFCDAQTGEPRVRKVHGAWHPWWIDMIGEAMTSVRPGVGGGLLFLYGGPTPQ